jgi:hypothetical protein
MLPILRQEITMRKWPLYLLTALFFFIVFIISRDNSNANHTKVLLAVGGLFLFIVLYYFLSKKKIVLDNDSLTIQLFFGKLQELKWKEISAVAFKWHFHGHGASLAWEFIPSSGKKISIQPSFYSRKNLQAIAETLVEKCPQAIIDKRILRIAGGKFPWYIF